MSNDQTTIVVGVDREHLNELRMSWATWFENWPGIVECPVLFLCDGVESKGWWWRQLARIVTHPMTAVELVPVGDGRVSQRHRMLSALVWGPARHVETSHYLKLDTDVALVEKLPNDWMRREWFDEETVIVARKWSYTKPASIFLDLQEWANQQKIFSGSDPLPVTINKDRDRAWHRRRIISYCQLGLTAFARTVYGSFLGKTDALVNVYDDNPAIREANGQMHLLPVASQDTTLWYFAERMKRKIAFDGMHGWAHGARRLERRYNGVFGVG